MNGGVVVDRISVQMFVHYETFFLVGDGAPEQDWDEAFEGQSNALCGAATGTYLCLRSEPELNQIDVALHPGIPTPAAEPTVTDVVELSLPAQSAPLVLTTWDGQVLAEPLRVPFSDLRVRYSIDPGDGEQVPRCLIDVWPAAMAPELIVLESIIGQARRRPPQDGDVDSGLSGAAVLRLPEPVVPASLPLSFATSDPPTSWSLRWQSGGPLPQLRARWNLTADDNADEWVELNVSPEGAGTGTGTEPSTVIADPPALEAMTYRRLSGVSIFSWTDRLGNIEIVSPRKRFAADWARQVRAQPTKLPPIHRILRIPEGYRLGAVSVSASGGYQAWEFHPADEHKLVYLGISVQRVDFCISVDQVTVRDPLADATAKPLARIDLGPSDPAIGAVFGDPASMRAVCYAGGYQIFGGAQPVHYEDLANVSLSAGFASVREAITAVELLPTIN